MTDRITPADLMSEDDVYKSYGKVLVNRELREARKAGAIGWFDLRAGPHYSVEQVMEYLRTRERKPCKKVDNNPLNDERAVPSPVGSLKSANTGSRGKVVGIKSAAAPMTPQLEELAASGLE